MGFCTADEYRRFLHQAPIFERMLVEDGIMLRKYWFSVSDEEQEARFRSRMDDPMRRWKLSPMDLESITRWEDYSRAKDDMFVHTDTHDAPWYVVESDDKRRARLNAIHHLLSTIPYTHIERAPLALPKRPPTTGYQRPPRNTQTFVPDHAGDLELAAAAGETPAPAGGRALSLGPSEWLGARAPASSSNSQAVEQARELDEAAGGARDLDRIDGPSPGTARTRPGGVLRTGPRQRLRAGPQPWCSAGQSRDSTSTDSGTSTASMTWITPLEASTSVAITLASLTFTPPSVVIAMVEPSTVGTSPAVTSAAMTSPETTW